MKLRRRQSGQGLILTILVVSLVASAIATSALIHTQHTHRFSVEHNRAISTYQALNGAAQWLHFVYHYQANCDPYILNSKINELPLRVWTSSFRVQELDNTPGLPVYIGELSPTPARPNEVPPPIGTAAAGALPTFYSAALSGAYGPQDVSVTYWVKPYGRLDTGLGAGTRYEQTITLINTCTFNSPAANAGPSFGSITNAATYTGYLATKINQYLAANADCSGAVTGTNIQGNINGDTNVDIGDRIAMRNYLKNGDTSGTSTNNRNRCMDFNRDGIVNEVDLNLMDKILKGYINIGSL